MRFRIVAERTHLPDRPQDAHLRVYDHETGEVWEIALIRRFGTGHVRRVLRTPSLQDDSEDKAQTA